MNARLKCLCAIVMLYKHMHAEGKELNYYGNIFVDTCKLRLSFVETNPVNAGNCIHSNIAELGILKISPYLLWGGNITCIIQHCYLNAMMLPAN